MVYGSCIFVQGFRLKFPGSLENGKINFCCAARNPRFGTFKDTPEETFRHLMELRDDVIAESKRFGVDGNVGKENNERIHTKMCATNVCGYFEAKEWESSNLITDIETNTYPSYCQIACCYCRCKQQGIPNRLNFNKSEHFKWYERLFNTIDYAKNNGLISDNVLWKISSGEITVHPYRDKFIELVGDSAAKWYTNCCVFDEAIAANLAINPRSKLFFSIDSGTAETWHKVKRVNNFSEMLKNLTMYFKSTTQPNQILLKYIVLPGINDNVSDYQGFIEIAKSVNTTHVEIAPDHRTKHDAVSRDRNISAGADLLAFLKQNDFSVYFGLYLQDAQKELLRISDEILSSNKHL